MKTLQKCFLLAVAALLVVGLVRTLCFPKEINDYENRYASQFPAASTSAFLDGTFQDEAESSLSDQIPFSQYMKKAYNNTKTSFLTPSTVSGPSPAATKGATLPSMGCVSTGTTSSPTGPAPSLTTRRTWTARAPC